MKKAVAAIIAVLMLAGLFSACSSESSQASAESNEDNTVIFNAENADPETAVNGNIAVGEDEVLVIAPQLTAGKVNITVAPEGSENETPTIEWEFEGTESTEYMPGAGEYEVWFTVTEKATGSIEVYTMPAESEGMEGMADPWRDITAEEANACVPNLFKAPEGAEDIHWAVMDGEENAPSLVELGFVLDGQSYVAREQITGDAYEDISGMYYEWGEPETVKLANWAGGEMEGKVYTAQDDLGMAKLCTWYNVEIGISYSLAAVGDDLGGLDIQAVAESMYNPDTDVMANMP